jgi:exonuclease VII small subunit
VSPRLAIVPELESELDDLYGRPLSDFTSARNELAKRLRKAGQDDSAERIQALKKPSVPVWTANQLARRHPDEVRALVDAGRRLRQAQETAFRSGEGRAAVRDATRDERDAARTLGRLAHELLAEEGRPPTRDATDRIASLLRAAAIDPDAAELLMAGRLAEEVEATGFGTVAEIAPRPTKRRKPEAAKDDEARRKEEEQRRKQLEAEVKKLRRASEQADAKLERAVAAAEEANARAREARRALTAAEAKLDA